MSTPIVALGTRVGTKEAQGCEGVASWCARLVSTRAILPRPPAAAATMLSRRVWPVLEAAGRARSVAIRTVSAATPAAAASPGSASRMPTAVHALAAAGVAASAVYAVDSGTSGGVSCESAASPVINESAEEVDDVSELVPQYKFRVGVASSHTDLFNTLASVEKNGQKLMTTADFVRSVVFKQLYYNGNDPLPNVDDVPMLQCLGDEDGLISLSEFMLLKALLSVPDDHIEVAFHMVDTDDSGTLSPAELCRIVSALTKRARDDTAPDIPEELPHRLGVRLFGRAYAKPASRPSCEVRPKAFKQFLLELRRAELAIRFRYFACFAGSDPDTMTAFQFGRFLVAHAHPVWAPVYFNRLSPLHALDSIEFTFDDFVAFDYALHGYSDDIHDALQFYLLSRGHCTMSVFERAVKVAAGVDLPRPITQTLFTVFNSNNDSSALTSTDLRRLFVLYSGQSTRKAATVTGVAAVDEFIECVKREA